MKLHAIILCFSGLFVVRVVPYKSVTSENNRVYNSPREERQRISYSVVHTEKEKHQSHQFHFHLPDHENAIVQSFIGSENSNRVSLWLGYIPMFFAVKNGYDEIVEELIKNNASVNVKNQNGSTPLQVACAVGYGNIVEILLRHNASIDIRNENGWSLCHIAGAHGHDQIVESLLSKGIDVNTKDNDGNTTLHLAALNNKSNVIEILLTHGADASTKNNMGKTAFMISVEKGYREVAALFIENWSNPDIEKWRTELLACIPRNADRKVIRLTMNRLLQPRGWPFSAFVVPETDQLVDNDINLEKAINEGDVTGAEMLITMCIPDMNNMRNLRPLLLATERVNVKMVKMLIKHGAKIDGDLYTKNTPLDQAVSNGSIEIVEVLLKNGANVNGQRNRYRDPSPLHYSSRLGNVEISRLLIQNGAKLDATDYQIKTPLHIANQYEVVKLLIMSGADIDARDSDEKTPLHVKTILGYLDLVNLLIENGSDVNATDTARWTALHYAALKDRIDVLKVLIKNGANVKARNNRGETAKEIADREGFAKSSDILKEAEDKLAASEPASEHLRHRLQLVRF